ALRPAFIAGVAAAGADVALELAERIIAARFVAMVGAALLATRVAMRLAGRPLAALLAYGALSSRMAAAFAGFGTAMRLVAALAVLDRDLDLLARGQRQARRFLGEVGRQRQGVKLDAGQLLDVAQIGLFVGRDEAHRNAVGAGTRGAADAVDILLRDIGQL